MLRAGIVGLPNVGKSTLFNALTRTRKAEAANYPFCTIEPNVGVVTVPDARLAPLAEIAKSTKIVPATIEFVDIAGLVKGASKGEGLGNKFLQHIREVDAIVEVVRCFEDKDVVHVAGALDPVADIETIQTELVLADIETLTRAREKAEKIAKGGDKEAQLAVAVAGKLLAHLDAGRRALTLRALRRGARGRSPLLPADVQADALCVQRGRRAISQRPTRLPAVQAVRSSPRPTSAPRPSRSRRAIEAELAELPEAEAREYLAHLGVAESGVGAPDPRRLPPARPAHLS